MELIKVAKKIILDCDPGLDDAVAMLLAHGSPDIELLAVTTVVGNQTLEKVTRNALGIASVAGISGVPFAAGCTLPLIRPVRTASYIHGDSGLGGVTLPEPNFALHPHHAVDLIIELVMSHPEKTITLVPVGALTNIALAARKEPRIIDRVKEVVLMGGACRTGNRNAVAEFNIWADPEAAHIVFNSSWPVTMVGLDLTHQALATEEVLDKIEAVGTGPARFVVDLLRYYRDTNMKVHGFSHPPVHDPCAVAYVIDSAVMTVRKAPIEIELHGSLTAGMTVADLRYPAPPECHTQVALELNTDYFWNMVIGALQRIGEVADSSVSRCK
ncbi:MAG: nucleoside hydrolase [Enterobacteriaceae bacterium]